MHSKEPVAVVTDANGFREIVREEYYDGLDGGMLEGLGKLSPPRQPLMSSQPARKPACRPSTASRWNPTCDHWWNFSGVVALLSPQMTLMPSLMTRTPRFLWPLHNPRKELAGESAYSPTRQSLCLGSENQCFERPTRSLKQQIPALYKGSTERHSLRMPRKLLRFPGRSL